MLAKTSYHTMAVNIISGALERGAILQNDSGAAYGGKSDSKPDGRSFYHAMRKVFKGHDGSEECKTEYEGSSVKEAAVKLIEICGLFDAMGLGIKWYRENANERQPTFDA